MVAKCFILLCSIITIASFAHGQDLYTLGKCALKDSDCHKEKIENFLQYYSDAGIPELDIGPLDPYHFNNVSISKKRVDFTIKNGILKGIKKCQVNYFRLFIEKGKAILDVTCDFTVEGQYKVHSDNTIFNFIAGGVIHGDGNLKLNADKLNIKIYYYFALRKQNGQIYIKGKEDRSHYVFNVQDRVAVVINNIYIGNQESSTKLTKMINTHWKYVVFTVGKDVMDTAMSIANTLLKKYFDRVPATELFFDDLTPYVTHNYSKRNGYYNGF